MVNPNGVQGGFFPLKELRVRGKSFAGELESERQVYLLKMRELNTASQSLVETFGNRHVLRGEAKLRLQLYKKDYSQKYPLQLLRWSASSSHLKNSRMAYLPSLTFALLQPENEHSRFMRDVLLSLPKQSFTDILYSDMERLQINLRLRQCRSALLALDELVESLTLGEKCIKGGV